MNIQELLIPTSNKKLRPRIKRIPIYITIHETDNPKAGADAEAHAKLQYKGNSRVASWHYSVDDKEIWRSIPDDEVGWACGDGGNGTGNRKSISIEICVNEDGNFQKAQANAKELVRYLMQKWNIPLERVVPHKHWSGKNCPRHILSNWKQWVLSIPSPPTDQAKVSKPSVELPYMETNFTRNLKVTRPMMKGNDIRKVQYRLGAVVDGYYGSETRAKVIAFQRSRNLIPDGIVGQLTWRALFW